MGLNNIDCEHLNQELKETLQKAHPTPPSGFVMAKLDEAIGWARKYSIFQYPFVTACCGMEFMSVAVSHYDIDRFGAGMPRFTPRQSDVLFVVGTINHKQAPILKRVYDQMCEPKWVIAFGACASSGGFYDNYTTVRGADRIIPVDIYIPGCPPRPEAVLDGLIMLQAKIQKEGYMSKRKVLQEQQFKSLYGQP